MDSKGITRWNKESTEQLITMYRENPILWDSKSSEHRDRKKKLKLYESIATKLSTTPEEIQRKLHNLRNQVSQELKKIQKKRSVNGTNDNNYGSNWPYFSALHFLVPVLTGNPSKLSLDSSQIVYMKKDEEHQPTASKESSDTLENMSECASPASVPTAIKKRMIKNPEMSGRSKPRKRAKYDAVSAVDHALSILRSSVDDNDIFGEYVASELKNLKSEYHRLRLKSEIRNSIARITEQDLHQFCNGGNTLPTTQ